MLFQTLHLEILDTLDFDCGSEKNAKFEPSRLSKAKKRSIRFFNASQRLKNMCFYLWIYGTSNRERPRQYFYARKASSDVTVTRYFVSFFKKTKQREKYFNESSRITGGIPSTTTTQPIRHPFSNLTY